MKYRVVWRKRILLRLHTAAFLIMEMGGNPAPLEVALSEIERFLESDPHQAGESREDDERVLIVHPLSVYFEVFKSSRTVVIYDAVQYPRRRL